MSATFLCGSFGSKTEKWPFIGREAARDVALRRRTASGCFSLGTIGRKRGGRFRSGHAKRCPAPVEALTTDNRGYRLGFFFQRSAKGGGESADGGFNVVFHTLTRGKSFFTFPCHMMHLLVRDAPSGPKQRLPQELLLCCVSRRGFSRSR